MAGLNFGQKIYQKSPSFHDFTKLWMRTSQSRLLHGANSPKSHAQITDSIKKNLSRVLAMAVQIVEFSSGGYKIRKTFA